MRSFWIAALACSSALAACGGADFKSGAGAAGRSARAAGAGGQAGRQQAAGSAGQVTSGAGGGAIASSGRAGGSASGRASSGGADLGGADDGGAPDLGGKGPGEPSEAGQAGVQADGGRPTGSGARGGSGGKGAACDCDAAHDCVKGACVLKPECDCKVLHVECSTLSSALADAYDCPIEVDCGRCPAGELCIVPYSDSQDLSFERSCIKPDTFSPPQGCAAAAQVDTTYGDRPVCSSASIECGTPYAYCSGVSGIVRMSDGAPCPAPTVDEFAMPDAFCGPPL